jgi:hypothetical protein
MLHNFRSWGIETVMRGIVNGTIAANRRPGSPTTDFRCLLNVRFSQKRKYRHAVLSDALGQKLPHAVQRERIQKDRPAVSPKSDQAF